MCVSVAVYLPTSTYVRIMYSYSMCYLCRVNTSIRVYFNASQLFLNFKEDYEDCMNFYTYVET